MAAPSPAPPTPTHPHLSCLLQLRALATLEGIGKALDPEYSFAAVSGGWGSRRSVCREGVWRGGWGGPRVWVARRGAQTSAFGGPLGRWPPPTLQSCWTSTPSHPSQTAPLLSSLGTHRWPPPTLRSCWTSRALPLSASWSGRSCSARRWRWGGRRRRCRCGCSASSRPWRSWRAGTSGSGGLSFFLSSFLLSLVGGLWGQAVLGGALGTRESVDLWLRWAFRLSLREVGKWG